MKIFSIIDDFETTYKSSTNNKKVSNEDCIDNELLPFKLKTIWRRAFNIERVEDSFGETPFNWNENTF